MDITPITNDAEYERAVARLSGTLNAPRMSDEEEEKLRLLSEEVERYSLERFDYHNSPRDGVDEVINNLDYDDLTLDDALRAFGGLERFGAYMTRESELDPATLETLVTEFGLDRAELEKPFTDWRGWYYVLLDEVECDDPECCDPDNPDWRDVLRGMVAAQGEATSERELEPAGV